MPRKLGDRSWIGIMIVLALLSAYDGFDRLTGTNAAHSLDNLLHGILRIAFAVIMGALALTKWLQLRRP